MYFSVFTLSLSSIFTDIADAFSSAYNSISDTILDGVFNRILNWIFETMFDGIAYFFTLMTSMGAAIFSLSWVKGFVAFFELFGWALFVTGLVVSAFDLAIEYQTGRANIKGTALNWLKGFFAVSLFTTVPVELYKFCCSLQNTFSNDLISLAGASGIASIDSLGELALDMLTVKYASDITTVYLLFCLLALGYCTIKIFFDNLKRGGIILIQIAVGSMYMFSIVRGYSDGFNNWVKQVFALCLTAFLQTTLLMLGLITFVDNMLLGVGVMLAAKEIPRVAERFGLDTSARLNIQGAAYTASSAVRLIKAAA